MSFTDDAGNAETLTSAATATVTADPNNAAPTVATVIQDRTATVGTALSYAFPADTFADTDAGDTLTYTATKSDDSALPPWLGFDAATRTFSGTPQAADVGTVSVKVTASDGNGGSVSDTFDIVVSAAANTAAMGAPTITGTAQVGKRLTAVTTGITDANGLTSVTYTYQWIRVDGGTETDITGANSSTYDLVAADQGKTIKVKVSFTDDGGNAETLTSAATATVTPVTPTLQLAEGINDGALQVAPNLALAGKFLLSVTFPGFTTVTGFDTDDVEVLIGGVVSSGAVLSVAPFGANGRSLVLQVDASTGGQTVTFRVKENAIAEGNAQATLDLGWTTESDPLTAAWSTTATAPVRSAFNVVLTFSHEINLHDDEIETVNAASFDSKGDSIAQSPDLSIVNGSITFFNLSPPNVLLSTTFTGRTTPSPNFEGLLRLTLEAGAVGKPAADHNSNNEAVFEILVDTKKPAPVSRTIDGTALTLTFSEALDETSVPAAGDFSVSVAGATATAPASLSLSGDTMTFTLATAVTSGQTVTIAYTKPTSDPIKDLAGNEADSFTAIEVTNNTGSVVDDDLPTVSIAAPTGATDDFLYEFEAATDELQYQWVLTRDGLTDETLTVNLSVAETDGDFVDAAKESATQTATFAVDEMTVGYTPITAEDTTNDAHGTVTVTVQSVADSYDAVSGSRAAATVAVRDDDGPLLEVSIDAAVSVPEGMAAEFGAKAENSDGTLTEARHLARLFSGLTEVAVTAQSADGTATVADSDYTAFDGPVALDTFEVTAGGGRWSGNVSVQTTEDMVTEGSEGFTVTLSLPAGTDSRIALSATDATGTATIVEGPALTLSVAPEELAEGATATVTASVDPVHDAAFTVAVAGMSDDDDRWEFVGGTTLTFEASQAAATGSVTIRAILNDVDEVDLDITLTGTPSVAAVAAPADVVLTVLDDDLPTVSIAAPTLVRDTGHLYEIEADTNRWELTRAGLTEDTLTVDLSVSDTGAFTVAGAAATAVFSAGMDTTSYTPITDDDDDDEAHGTVTVTVDAGTGYAPGTASSAAVAVRDDDGPLLEVSIDAAVTAPEGMAAVFGAKAENSDGTLTAAGDLARLFSGLTAVTVNAQSADGSAMAASDYTAFDGSVALDAFEVTALGGRWSGNVSVQTTEDMVTEGSQDFTVTLSLPGGTDSRIALSATDATGTATIVEGPALTLSVAPEELAEGATATVTASVDPVHDAAFTVAVAGMSDDDDRWEFVGGTTLTFEASQAAATGSVTIRAILNDVDEVDLDITLTGTPSVAAVAAPADVVLTVLDDDLPTVSIAAPTGTVDGFLYEAEAATDESRYQWSLTRDGLTDGELSVDVSVAETGGGDFVADGTDIVMFDAGESTVFYTPITADTADEAHGTVTVTVESGSEYALGTASSAEVDVRDDDGTLLTVSLEPSSVTVTEGGAARFEVVAATVFDDTFTAPRDLDRMFSVQNLPVLVSSTNGTASSTDGDYEKKDTTTTVAFADLSVSGAVGARGLDGRFATATFEAYTDAVEDAGETFNVGLRFSGTVDGRIALDADNSISVATIVEGPSVTLTLSEDEIREGETATVTATVDPVHDVQFTVTVAGTSTDDARWEFVDSGTTLTFAANQAASTGTVTIRAISNDDDDGDVEVELTATPSLAAVVVSAPVTLMVLDNDLPQVSIAAPTGATDDFLYEFEAATDELQYQWVLTRDGLIDETLTVNLSVSEALGDFVDAAKESATQTVTFAADEMTVGYTPITAEDTTNDAHGTVTVTVQSLADSYDAVSGSRAAATVAVRDDDGELVTVTLDPDPATLKVKEGREAQLYAEAETEEGTFDEAAHLARLFGATVTQAQAIASTEASTGTGAATAGTDYTALAAETVELPFADFEPGSGGVLRLRVALPGIATEEDEVTDPDETFKVKLAAPTGQDARIVVSTTAATVTINEGPSDGAIRLCSGIAASTCTDVEKALAARNTEGRVEVIYNDEWGTVCDDYWSNGDGNVACRQMGFAGAERVFWNSHFGGAARGTEIWLDNLQCVGNEKDLLECRRRGNPAVGDHNCSDRRHTEDAGVRCLKAESELHGAKVDPSTLTIAPGGTGRYWVSLTKNPEADVVVYPKLDTEAEAALEVTEGPRPFPRAQWNYALDVDVTVQAGAALGTYTVTHTMDLHNNAVVEDSDVTELTFAVPPVKVKVVASTSVSGPAPVSATVSGRDASVRFDAPLDASFAPSTADFAVLADGRRLAVTGAWTAGRALLLELAEPATGAVRLAYVPSAAAPLGGRDGSPVSPFETLALAGELADDAPDTLTADVEPKLEGAPGLEAALADALRDAPGPVAATLAAPRRAVADLSGLGALPQLRRVNLAGNAVTDAGPLALLADLERLDLSGNAVQDLWPLSGLAELRVLDLSGNRVVDVTALAGLPRLRVLELSGNAVADLSPLGALPSLEYLGLSGNRVVDVAALADLYALTRLDLGGNAVADAAPLGDAGRLVWLRLSGNRLATLDGLGRLTMLRWVWVAGNPLPDATTVVWPERAWVDVAADAR